MKTAAPAEAGFAAAFTTAPPAPPDPNAIPQNTSNERQGTAPEVPPFQGTLAFTRKNAPLKVRPFALSDVRLLPGPFLDAQEWNRAYVRRLSADRLLHNFRVNAGLPSSAQPLGGWEEPKCELRGHFAGHYLFACGLLYASTGDKEIKAVVNPTFIAGVTQIQPLFTLAPSATYPFNYPLPTIPTTGLNSAGGLAGVNSAVWDLDRNMTSPLAVNYVIGVERELPWKFVAGGSYSGSKSYSGLSGINYNRANGDLIANNGKLVYPNPNFGSINYVGNILNGSYNAMILTLRRAVGKAATFQASYTLSHATSDINSNTRFDHDIGFDVPDPALYHSYYADANWDVRNHFSFSGVYTVPGMKTGIAKALTSGWEVGILSSIQSGTPFWVHTTAPFGAGGDYNADGTNYDIPNAPANYCGGSYGEQNYLTGLFPASTFTAPSAGTEGNLRRNSCRNPGMVEVDASVLKNTRLKWLGEQGNLQLRFDFENVLNKVNLAGIDSNMADATFGRSTQALIPRTIQLGARISF